MSEAMPSMAGRQAALDGKTLCGSAIQGKNAVHLMSAFATDARLVLATQAVADKGNE